MQRKEFNPGGLYFYGHGDCSDLTLLEKVLKDQYQKHRKVIAVFTECPSNPLLLCPNFQRYVCRSICMSILIICKYMIYIVRI